VFWPISIVANYVVYFAPFYILLHVLQVVSSIAADVE